MSRRQLGCALAAVLLGTSLAAADGRWTQLRAPGPTPGAEPYFRTWCYDVNQRGDMVGAVLLAVTPAGNFYEAFLLSNGRYTNLHPGGTLSSTAWGINSRGDVVGEYYALEEGVVTHHGFLVSKGEFSTLDIPGAAMSHLRGINARGDIVGAYMDSMDPNVTPPRGFLLSKDGTFTEIEPEGSTWTWPMGINERADIVGQYYDSAGVMHGFLRTADGTFTTLDFPGALSTSAESINARGEIVGYYWEFMGMELPPNQRRVSHGFRWVKGEFFQENFPGAEHTMVHGLNDRGDTCGMMSFTRPSPYLWGGFSFTKAGR